MKVSELTVRNFRNLAALDVEIPSDGVVVVGPNGQGKTNLLEALYYLVLFRSFRAARDRDLVRFGQAGFFVGATAAHRVTAGFEVAGRRKKVSVDGAPVNRLGEAVGHVTAVPFSPADRELVTGGPSVRRRYLDVVLSLSDRSYLRQLSAMRTALKQRNAALRRSNGRAAQAFDAPFVSAAVAVATRRHVWADEWEKRYAELCTLLGESAPPTMIYRSRHWKGPEEGTEGLHRELGRTLERDLRHGATTVGPHRDELVLSLDEHDLRSFGSAGQQRTAATALRILEVETLTRETGETPVTLYDDVFVELDTSRQERLLDLIQHALPGQVLITAPRDSEVPPALCNRPRWSMEGGRIGQG